MSTTIETHDFLIRPRPWQRRRRLRFDDVREVHEGSVITRDGARYALPAALTEQLRAIVDGPPVVRHWEQCRTRVAAFLAGPHGSERAVRLLCEVGETLGATDLHLEPEPDGAQLRLRIAGELRSFASLPKRAVPSLVAALKALAGCLPYRRDVLQEGRIPRTGVAADIRASFVPTAFGERVALRFFGRRRRLEELGLGEAEEATLRTAIAEPHGLVIIAGRTGAGKTTTLYACLAHLAEERPGAYLSLEDPIEQRLRRAGIAVDQVELCPERGLDGEAILAASLRQDVDVLAVGELRTPDEAQLALRAAHTGRLVLAGVHAGSSEQAWRRLLDLEVDPARLNESLRLILYQALDSEPCACAGEACPECAGLGRRRRLRANAATHPWREGMEVIRCNG